MRQDNGTITDVKEWAFDYQLSYANKKGDRIAFIIRKNETLKGDFIASAPGLSVEIESDNRGKVRMAKIGGTLVLQRC